MIEKKDSLKLVFEGSSVSVWSRLLMIISLFTMLVISPSRFLWPVAGIIIVLLIVVFGYFFYDGLKNNILLLQFKGGVIFVNYMFGKKIEYKISDSVSCVQKKINITAKYGGTKGEIYKVQFGKGDEIKTLNIPDFDTNNKSNNVSSSIRISNNAKN